APKGVRPGCLLRKPPDGIDRRLRALAKSVSASVFCKGAQWFIAGWSSPVARQAHNLKVIGSNPIPATTDTDTPVAKAAEVSRFQVFSTACASIQPRIVPNSPCKVASIFPRFGPG